ncbi:MAG: ACT domain-containing protein [Vicinamibacterales bacterium]
MRIRVLSEPLAMIRLEPSEPWPDWLPHDGFVSVTRTSGELSIVCAVEAAPTSARVEAGWCALEVDGPLDFALTGVLVSLAVPLANADVSIFVISTFDTDYMLVRAHDLERAIDVLRSAGHVIED